MRPTPIYDELTARQRERTEGRVGPRSEAASILSFPVEPPQLPARPGRHALRRG